MDFGQLIASVLAILIGTGVLVYAGVSIARGAQRKNWPQTTGEIVESVVTRVGHRPTAYIPNVRYRYKVNLVDYESNVILASEALFATGNDRYAKSQVEKYQLYNEVPIYYNPDNPAEAVLEKTGASLSGMLLLIILGIPSMLCGLLLLLGFLVQGGILKGLDF